MDTDLYLAAISGDIRVLREKERTLVEKQLTPDKNSVLHVASESGETEFVQKILSMHPSLLSKQNSRFETALHLAVREGYSPVVEALIEEAKKSLVPSDENDLENDLEKGVGFSKLEAMLRMLRTTNVEGDTALHEGARYNQVDAVRVLIKEFPEENSLHTPNKAGETPIYLAAYRGFLDMMKIICETCRSAPYNGPDGRTALHAAIIHEKESSNYECVKYLLGWKRDLINETDVNGWTAFHYAAYYNRIRIIYLLIEADKSVAYLTEKKGNRTALHIAATAPYSTDAMKKLISFCPDSCYMIDKRGQNLLHIAVMNNNRKMIECILQNCPRMSRLLIQKDTDGNTPLHLLAILGCFAPKIIKHRMADREALNKENLTPLDVLYKDEEPIAEQLEIRSELEDVGANRTGLLWNTIRDYEHLKTGKDRITLAAEAMRKTAEARNEERKKAREHEKAMKTAEKARKKTEKIKEEEEAKKTERERVRRMGETHVIVAALVATVSFTAGFTVPGGFNDNEGPNHGLAILTRKDAFKAFMVTDTIALLLSTASLLVYFFAATLKNVDKLWEFYKASAYLNIVAIGAMMLAFITGTYVVLAHSLPLAITVCAIGCCFFIILLFVIIKRFWVIIK